MTVMGIVISVVTIVTAGQAGQMQLSHYSDIDQVAKHPPEFFADQVEFKAGTIVFSNLKIGETPARKERIKGKILVYMNRKTASSIGIQVNMINATPLVPGPNLLQIGESSSNLKLKGPQEVRLVVVDSNASIKANLSLMVSEVCFRRK
jgi:hypothetical protein